jgi:ATP-dependent Clp protease ATP-binding subunit ClpA
MFERFTIPAREVVLAARAEAQSLGHDYIGTEHLLLALLRPEAGVASSVLERAGVTAQGVRADVVRLLGCPQRPLGEQDAVALRSIGIDLDAVLARLEQTFGVDASKQPDEPGIGVLGRRRRPFRPTSRFTNRAKKVLQLGLREAVVLGSSTIGTEHILLGLLREGLGLGARVLISQGRSLEELRSATLQALDRAA